MRAVILAGGEGTRLRPLTENRPKPLVPIAGKPCIRYAINSLTNAGIRNLIVTTGYLSHKVIAQAGDGSHWGSTIIYSVEEQAMGTAGAVKKVEGFLDDTFIVVSGDLLTDVSLSNLVSFHKNRHAVATMALTSVENPCEYGIVGLDEEGRITRFKEKPTPSQVFSNMINAGIYILEPEVLDLVPKNRIFDFSKDLFPILLKEDEPLYGRRVRGLWMDIGRPADLIRANIEVAKREGGPKTLGGRKFKGPIILGKDVKIAKTATIEGACYLGEGCQIVGSSKVIDTAVHPNAKIDSAFVQESIVLEGAYIAPGSKVTECIIGEDSVVSKKAVIHNTVVNDNTIVKGR